MTISELRNKMSYGIIVFILSLGSFFFVLLNVCNWAWAQEKGYPNQPIKLVVPYGPGGTTDIPVRAMTDYLSSELKVPVIVENKSGAGGMVGTTMVFKAPPDGYTLIVGGDGPMISAPLASPNPPYDARKDFLPICTYGTGAIAYGVHNSSPFKTMVGLIEEAKKNPGKIKCGVMSIGGPVHLALELFLKEAALNIKQVPYKNTGEAIAAFLGKHIDMLIISYVAFRPYVKGGEGRILAVADSFPGCTFPTLAELGYEKAKYSMFSAVWVSSKTPKPIYEKLVLAFERVVKNPELREKWEKSGLIPLYRSPIETANTLKERWDIISRLLDELNLKQK